MTTKRRLTRALFLAVGLFAINVAPASAGDVSFSGSEVTYIDFGNEENNVTVTDYPTYVRLTDSAGVDAVSGSGCTKVDPFTATCNYPNPAPQFRAAVVAVGNLGDAVRYRASGGGFAGFDLTRTSDAQGNDIVDGSSGRDLVLSGPGNDVYRLGAGADRVYAAESVSFPTFSGFAAGAGNDLIYGGSGNDILSGGANNDRIYGGFGNDRLRRAGRIRCLHGGGRCRAWLEP